MMNKGRLLILYSLFSSLSFGLSHAKVCDNNKTKKSVINNAIKEIKQDVNDKSGIFTICCTYKIFDGQPILSTKRIHYSQYRKKSDFVEFDIPQNFAKKTPDKIMEITYKKPKKNQFLSLVHRHPIKKNKRLCYEKVSIPRNYFI